MKTSVLIPIFSFTVGALIGGLALYSITGSSSKPEQPYYEFQGKMVYKDDLAPDVAQSLHQIENQAFTQTRNLINSAIIHRYARNQAKQIGISEDEVLAKLLGADEPEESTLKAFYDENRSRIPVPYEEAKEQIAQHLMTHEMQQQQTGLLEKFEQEGKAKNLLQAPVAPRAVILSQGFPSKGNPNASVTIIEFADYQCPHCKEAHGVMKQLMEEYADRVNLTYMDFPINRSGISRKVAEGAVCADQQGQFWAYQDAAFEAQESLAMESPQAIAGALSLDQEAFNSCLDNPDTLAKVNRSAEEAKRLKLTGTPTFFVNGAKVETHDFKRDLAKAIEDAL